MTGRDLANLEAALAMLRQGRTYDARETLAVVIRENGGTVPTPPTIGGPTKPTPEPAAMRLSA